MSLVHSTACRARFQDPRQSSGIPMTVNPLTEIPVQFPIARHEGCQITWVLPFAWNPFDMSLSRLGERVKELSPQTKAHTAPSDRRFKGRPAGINRPIGCQWPCDRSTSQNLHAYNPPIARRNISWCPECSELSLQVELDAFTLSSHP